MNKEQELNDLFAKARSEAPKTSFEETSKQFAQSLEATTSKQHLRKGKVFTSKTKSIMSISILISGLLTSIIMWSYSSNKKTTHNIQDKQQTSEEKQQRIVSENSPSVATRQTPSESSVKTQPHEQDFFIFNSDKDAINDVGYVESPNTAGEQKDIPDKAKIPLNDTYQFPKLTEEEIKKTAKQKKKMLKALVKMDNDVYSYIPAGSFEFSGEKISVQSFFIQRTEVSNLEYRTFLFDLLIQNRKAEFLLAKPDQAMWTKVLGKGSKAMEDTYFSDEAYNAYPVNNISREGAELYCKWLYEELLKSAGDKSIQCANMRIPSREEWIKAASNNGQNSSYPWKVNFIQNEKNCYLANHKPTDSTYFDDGAFYTAKVDSYFPNEFGLYNMSGNVAEMVVDGATLLGKKEQKTTPLTPGTAGGGWMNSGDEIKLSAPDNHPNETNPHPNIGFRVVMTHLGRGFNLHVK
jgi:formylglycine-generating enzyme required for sulfatase activity